MARNLLEQIIEEEVAIELEEVKAGLKAKIYDEVKAECHAEGRASFLRILLKESSPTEISRKYGISLEEINSVAGSMMA